MMPDRSLRLLTLPPQSVEGGEHRGVLLRERPASPPDAPSDRKSGDSPEDEHMRAAAELALSSRPSTCGRTVTVLSARTVPTPSR